MGNRSKRRVAARRTWDRLETSFWFAPLIMTLAAVLLAWFVYWVDGRIPNEALQDSRLVLSGTVGEMRTALLSMATTVLATAGVVFTLLTLPLSTVAAQYGSRLLRIFLGDRTTQLVLAMFSATFVYCLAAALSIPPVEVEPDGPQLTATVGLYLMLATFASLILLVQHISTMLQAPNIAAAAGEELADVVSAEIADVITSGNDRAVLSASPTGQTAQASLVNTEAYSVTVNRTGYVQNIDPETILALAREKDLVIRLLHRPGHFVRSGVVVARVWPSGRADAQLDKSIRDAFQLGNARTPTQDVEYAVNQLTEMAVRAMSPAINDPFTAMTCLDHIGDGLTKFIRQGDRGSHYYDQDGGLRLILEPVTLEGLLSAAFDMLRHASCDNASVLLHMLEVIDVIGEEAKTSQARKQLTRHVYLIQEESQVGNTIKEDRQAIQLRGQALQSKFEGAA